eukprot:m.113217 g.113217  ORF g.113217 m.113217 type:complete len:293 (-) comp12798_c1_seq5:219-1097(-)
MTTAETMGIKATHEEMCDKCNKQRKRARRGGKGVKLCMSPFWLMSLLLLLYVLVVFLSVHVVSAAKPNDVKEHIELNKKNTNSIKSDESNEITKDVAVVKVLAKVTDVKNTNKAAEESDGDDDDDDDDDDEDNGKGYLDMGSGSEDEDDEDDDFGDSEDDDDDFEGETPVAPGILKTSTSSSSASKPRVSFGDDNVQMRGSSSKNPMRRDITSMDIEAEVFTPQVEFEEDVTAEWKSRGLEQVKEEDEEEDDDDDDFDAASDIDDSDDDEEDFGNSTHFQAVRNLWGSRQED